MARYHIRPPAIACWGCSSVEERCFRIAEVVGPNPTISTRRRQLAGRHCGDASSILARSIFYFESHQRGTKNKLSRKGLRVKMQSSLFQSRYWPRLENKLRFDHSIAFLLFSKILSRLIF